MGGDIVTQLRELLAWAFKHAILFAVIQVAATVWLAEKIVEGIARQPRTVTGTNPPGAAPIVAWWAKWMIWATSGIRGWLAGYVQPRHPRAYQFGIFH